MRCIKCAVFSLKKFSTTICEFKILTCGVSISILINSNNNTNLIEFDSPPAKPEDITTDATDYCVQHFCKAQKGNFQAIKSFLANKLKKSHLTHISCNKIGLNQLLHK